MLMTANEAREKWCPMVRIARREVEMYGRSEGQQHIVAGCNTDALGRNRVPASCRCIASECAMWRWATKGLSCANIEPTGYCGIAGRPEVIPC